MRRLIVVLGFLFLSVRALAQPPDPLLTFGRGEIVSAAWAPDGQSVWIGTTAGTWQLDANLQEIAAHPHITYAALSPDGTKLAGAALGGEVGVWDSVSGDAVWVAQESYASDDATARVPVWSPDSERFAFSSRSYPIVVDYTSERLRYVGGGESTYLAWSSSGRYIAGFVEGQGIWAYDWDMQTSVALQGFTRFPDLGSSYLLWRGDEELLWNSLGDGGNEGRWAMPDGRQLTDDFGPCSYTGCAFSPDDRLVAATGTVGLRVRDAVSYDEVFRLEDQTFWLPTWSPDGSTIATIHWYWRDQTIRRVSLYDADSGVLSWDQPDVGCRTEFLSWNADATRLLAVGTGRIAVLDAQTGGILSRSEAFRTPDVIALDTTAERVAVSDTFGDVTTLAVNSGERLDTVLGTTLRVGSMVWQPGGRILAILSYMPESKTYVYLRDIDTVDGLFGDLTVNTVHQFEDQRLDLEREYIAWSPDGDMLAIATINRVQLYGEVNEELRIPGIADDNPGMVRINEIRWTEGDYPEIHYATCCGGGGWDTVVDFDTGDSATRYAWLPWSLSTDGYFAVLHPLEYTYTSRSLGFVLRLVTEDTAPRGTAVPLPGMTADMSNGWISPLTTFTAAAAYADGSGIIWNTKTGEPLQFIAQVHNLVWSPDEATLAILRRDGSVWLQDADGLRVLWSPLVPVRSPGTVVWSGDSAAVALVQDGVARVWRP